MKRICLLLFSILCSLISIESFAMTANEVIAKANLASYYKGDDGRAFVKMTITDEQGRERIREFVILRKDLEDAKEQKFFIYFKEPADVRDMVYMVWKNIDKDDDRWLYMQALDLVRRVAASDKRTSFVGSHFVYEDVSGRSVDDDNHILIKETDSHYVIKSTPKDPSGLEFNHYIVNIDKQNFIPLQAEYFNKSGESIRLMEALDVQDIQSYPTVLKMKATDYVRGGTTVLEYDLVEYDLGLDDNVFTERSLKRPPRKYLRK